MLCQSCQHLPGDDDDDDDVDADARLRGGVGAGGLLELLAVVMVMMMMNDGDGDGMLLEVVMWRRWPRRHDFLCRQSVTNQLRKFWHEGTNPGLDLTPESTQTRIDRLIPSLPAVSRVASCLPPRLVILDLSSLHDSETFPRRSCPRCGRQVLGQRRPLYDMMHPTSH